LVEKKLPFYAGCHGVTGILPLGVPVSPLPRRSQTKAGLAAPSQIKPGKDKSRQTKPDQARMFFSQHLVHFWQYLAPNPKPKPTKFKPEHLIKTD
jgi:hypothetical protein